MSILVVGGGGADFLPGPPRAPPTPPPRYICPSWWGGGGGGGGGFDTWYPSKTPESAVYVRPGEDWIKMVTRPLLYSVDNLILVLVIEV